MRTTTIPEWFAALFRELVTAHQPRDITPTTMAVYYDGLMQLGEPKLRAAAATLRRGRFFPTLGEWYATAMKGAPTARGAVISAPAVCPRCENRGLVAIHYHTGEPFDVAICACRAAAVFRIGGELLVRHFLGIEDKPEHRVSDLASFDE